MDEQKEFFSLKLVYDGHDKLVSASLNGEPMELFDVRNPDGSPSGIVRERGVAHREGSLHATVHIWVVRENDKSGFDVLLQKRSASKDSHPGFYDISSAGHIAAGEDYLPTAVRELSEELGISASESELQYVGIHRGGFEDVFYGRPFKDEELSAVYVYAEPVRAGELRLQESEVEEVVWIDYEECRKRMEDGTLKNCVYADEFEMVGTYLGVL